MNTTSADSDVLNPAQNLTDFFVLERALGFHDQTFPPACYSYGCALPAIVYDECGEPTSGFRLTTSPAGAKVTLITPLVPLDTAPIAHYIHTAITHSDEAITLELIPTKTALWLYFAPGNQGASAPIAFENGQIALTHAQGVVLTDAIQGTPGRAFLLAKAAFTVFARVTVSLQANWHDVLVQAIRQQARTAQAVSALLYQQIEARVIVPVLQCENAPSWQTQQKANDAAIKQLTPMIVNTLKNVTTVEDVPQDLSYRVTYSESYPQEYLLEQSYDMAVLLRDIPAATLISFTPLPLPEPEPTPDKPTEKHTCRVSLGFNAATYRILSIELAWRDRKKAMQWPSFPALTLEAEGDVDDINVTVTFADYSKFSARLAWAANVTLSPQDIGLYTVVFNAEKLQAEFKSISGSATYYSENQKIKLPFSFSFANQQWKIAWPINIASQEWNGWVEYRWQGKISAFISKNYDSGVQKSIVPDIELKYIK
ncbi:MULTISPECIES: hypothetical protein [Dickeya]|uniref:Uncharacterized protein n=1 Tax=Dickeya aquatica TaxID=1401087 RepID=A0A375A928_9GAMM|nr:MULTISPECIES: hypothetical protein [Dickeya]SLM62578.1 hypothetical protein DAQ1742_01621 [Dickeya aquatica]